MDIFKLRIKLEQGEFEAEGSQDYVEQQRDIFLDKIETLGSKQAGGATGSEDHKNNKDVTAGDGEPPAPESGNGKPPVPTTLSLPISVEDMGKIVHLNGDLVTLTAMPTGEDPEVDALLLLLLGHKVLRGVDLAQAEDLLGGMKQSGFSKVERLDRITPRVNSSWLSSVGSRRGKKYRLLNPGISRAKELATQLITSVA